ncbi:hypothetical protein NEM56_25880, partial [Escherichia coli]|nr:hypothetical protein [Escherichia coli]
PLPLMITVINYSTSRQDGNNTSGYPFRYWLILAFAIPPTGVMVIFQDNILHHWLLFGCFG